MAFSVNNTHRKYSCKKNLHWKPFDCISRTPGGTIVNLVVEQITSTRSQVNTCVHKDFPHMGSKHSSILTFGEYVMGVGKFSSAVLINTSTWLKSDINSSRLDKYYVLLAFINYAGMIINWFFAVFYGDEIFLSDINESDIETGDSVLLDHINFSGNTEECLLNQDSCQETEESRQQLVISESAAANAPLLRLVRSFQRPSSSRGIHRRFNSMR